MINDRILIVDDEANVLASLRRHLHRQKYEITTASSGLEGLELIQKQGPFAVIISDYRMPGMNGIEFLARAQQDAPDTVRMMLTGTSELDVALNAVNRGNIFRFMQKPIAPDDLIRSVGAGVEQYRLITAERELMEELSIMQRIDRELNVDLDTQRTMQITLHWAMNRSHMDAGLIGSVKDGGVRIMASEGYQQELERYSDAFIPLSAMPLLKKVVEDKTFCHQELADHKGLLENARCQVLFPICREKNSIGVLLLERATPGSLSEESINFLTRLCDHASIAIANGELLDQVKAANQAKTEFVSFVSHELKNPITSVSGFAELLLNPAVGQLSDTQKNMVFHIRSAVKQMRTLVTDLADISRIESGHLKLELEGVSVQEVVKEVIDNLRPQIEEKKQTVQVILPESLSPVWADRSRVVQVITNLISNGHKYTPDEGKIVVGAEESLNKWDEKGAPAVIHLWVQDDGIGIKQEDQGNIFQKFFRAKEGSATDIPGTGLGLNITKNLVEMQGGSIWFESEYGKGTTFHITLPLASKAD